MLSPGADYAGASSEGGPGTWAGSAGKSAGTLGKLPRPPGFILWPQAAASTTSAP